MHVNLKIVGLAFAATIIVLLAFGGRARAYDDTLRITTTRVPQHWLLNRDPRIIHVPQPTTAEDRKAQADEIAKWEAFCQPRRGRDEYGVIRLSYAQKGCEFGRSE